MKKTKGDHDKIVLPKAIRAQFTPWQTSVLAVVYLGSQADFCRLTLGQIARHAGINLARVQDAIVLAAQLGVIEVIVDNEGTPTLRNILIKRKVPRS